MSRAGAPRVGRRVVDRGLAAVAAAVDQHAAVRQQGQPGAEHLVAGVRDLPLADHAGVQVEDRGLRVTRAAAGVRVGLVGREGQQLVVRQQDGRHRHDREGDDRAPLTGLRRVQRAEQVDLGRARPRPAAAGLGERREPDVARGRPREVRRLQARVVGPGALGDRVAPRRAVGAERDLVLADRPVAAALARQVAQAADGVRPLRVERDPVRQRHRRARVRAVPDRERVVVEDVVRDVALGGGLLVAGGRGPARPVQDQGRLRVLRGRAEQVEFGGAGSTARVRRLRSPRSAGRSGCSWSRTRPTSRTASSAQVPRRDRSSTCVPSVLSWTRNRPMLPSLEPSCRGQVVQRGHHGDGVQVDRDRCAGRRAVALCQKVALSPSRTAVGGVAGLGVACGRRSSRCAQQDRRTGRRRRPATGIEVPVAGVRIRRPGRRRADCREQRRERDGATARRSGPPGLASGPWSHGRVPALAACYAFVRKLLLDQANLERL